MAAAASAAGGPYMRQARAAIIGLILLFVAIKSGLWGTSKKNKFLQFMCGIWYWIAVSSVEEQNKSHSLLLLFIIINYLEPYHASSHYSSQPKMSPVFSKNICHSRWIWTLRSSANTACTLSLLLRHDDCFVCCSTLFLTELLWNLCWHVVVLISRMCKLFKQRTHLWSDGLLRGELHFQVLKCFTQQGPAFAMGEKWK